MKKIYFHNYVIFAVSFLLLFFSGRHWSLANDNLPKETLPVSNPKPVYKAPFKPLPFKMLLANVELYEFNPKAYAFDKIVGLQPILVGKEWQTVTNDPVRFTLTPNKKTAVLGEEIELTLTAELLDISPRLLFTLEELRNYSIKVILPQDFIQTGGTYLNFATGTLDPANPKHTYTIKGRYLDKPALDDCFKVLRKLNDEVFVLKNTTCINVTNVDILSVAETTETNNIKERSAIIDMNKVRLSASVFYGTNQNDNDYFDGVNGTSYLMCDNRKNLIQFGLPLESAQAIGTGDWTFKVYKNDQTEGVLFDNLIATLPLADGIYKYKCVLSVYDAAREVGNLIGTRTQEIIIDRTTPCPTNNSLSITANETALCPGASTTISTNTNCPTAGISWQKNGIAYGSNGATTSVTTTGIYKAVCNSPAMISNTITINVSGTPTVPNVKTDRYSITPGEFATLTATNCQGTVVWQGPNNFTDTGDEISVGKQGNYQALCRSNCNGTTYYSDLSAIVGISLLPLRLEADKYEKYSNETAQISAYGCNNGYISWKVNGETLPQSDNPLTAYSSGTYAAQCRSFNGTESDWVALYISEKTSTTPRVTASKTHAYPTDNVTLSASGCPSGWYYKWEIPVRASDNSVTYQYPVGTPQTVQGPATYKVQCILNDQNQSAYESVTVNTLDIGQVVINISANKTEANIGEPVIFTVSGNCPNGGGIRWIINGMNYWSYVGETFQGIGPGTYAARCESGPQISQTVYYTVKSPKPGGISIVSDKTRAKDNELVTLRAIGCTNEVNWTLPNGTEVRGSTILFNFGPGIYKAKCVNKFGFTSDPASITIAERNWNEPTITQTNTSIAINEMVEYVIEGCPNDWVQWGVPKKDGNGNIYYDYSYSFKTHIIREPGVYKVRCSTGDYTNFQDIVVHPAPANGLFIKANRSVAKYDEAVVLTAFGCPNGTVRWEYGNVTTTGTQITVIGPGLRKARCLNDYSNNGDWAMAQTRSDGSITPYLTATVNQACPNQPVTINAYGCPNGWWYGMQWVKPGQLDYWLNNRNAVENYGQGFWDVFDFGGGTVTRNGPNVYYARCISPDGSWRGDFRDKSITVDPAFPTDLRATNNGPAMVGDVSVRLAVTEVPGASYAWSGPVFASSLRSPQITELIAAKSGIYTVTLNKGAGQPWGCSATATTEIKVTGCESVRILAVDAVTGEEINTLRRNLQTNQFNPIALSITGMRQESFLQFNWSGPDNNNVTTPNIITNKSGVYTAYINTIGGTNGCRVSTNIFEPKEYDIAWNDKRQGAFANGQVYDYYPVSISNVRIKYYIGDVEIQKEDYELGLIEYLSGTILTKELLHIIPTKEGINSDNSNFEGIILQTDFFTNNVKHIWKYVNGVAVGSINTVSQPLSNAREINDICKVVIQTYGFIEGCNRKGLGGCPFYVEGHDGIINEITRFINCNVTGTNTSSAPTKFGGGGTTIQISNFSKTMCQNADYLLDQNVLDLVFNPNFPTPCINDNKKYRLFIKLIELGMREELSKLDMQDGVNDGYVNHTVTNNYENIMKPSKVPLPNGTSIWDTKAASCSITERYTALSFKYPADREKLYDAISRLQPKVKVAYLALSKFLQDCAVCPAGANFRPNSVPCCNGDILDEVWNTFIDRRVSPFDAFEMNGDDAFIKEEYVSTLWYGLKSGKTVYPTGNPDNADEVKINLLGRTVKYSPKTNGNDSYLSFVTCGESNVVDFNPQNNQSVIVFVNGYWNSDLPYAGDDFFKDYWSQAYIDQASIYTGIKPKYYINGANSAFSSGVTRFNDGVNFINERMSNSQSNFYKNVIKKTQNQQGDYVKPIYFVSHSMGGAFAEGMIKALSMKGVKIGKVFHFSPADVSDFNLNFPDKTIQMDIFPDPVLAYKNLDDARFFSNVKNYGIADNPGDLLLGHMYTKTEPLIWRWVHDLEHLQMIPINPNGNTVTQYNSAAPFGTKFNYVIKNSIRYKKLLFSNNTYFKP